MFPSPALNQDDACRQAGRQKTISQPFRLEGIGLHSGKPARLFFSPSPENSGIVFIHERKRIPARFDGIVDTTRGTSLPGIAVVEHLLSAVNGLLLDNLLIEVEGPEIPNFDGSALPFVEALERAGVSAQREPKDYLTAEPVKIIEGESSLEAMPYRGLKIDFMVDFPAVGRQRFIFDSETQDYKKEIAPARTFGYLEEYERLKQRGLAFGASLENALVLDKNGYVNQPRFPDEIVRHKILDLIGDLALAGRPLRAEIIAVKSGHAHNLELLRRLVSK
jgi:UDP-3-O-acyl N-acetylglucosamine deacetylase